MNGAAPPLEGIRVLDAATLFAGPLIAMVLGDYGAEVIKIEHPRGDPVRNHGYSKDGISLWWKMLARHKKAITLYLGSNEGQSLLLRLVHDTDVLIENFRPGTLERWGLGPDRLLAENRGLVLVRVTGFGQFGPYARRPGFGTVAEAMSGFAHMTGQADGPPTLPPFGLADGIAGLAGVGAVLMALYARDSRDGKGQVVDLSIIEPILTVLGAQPTVYDQLGIVQQRVGNRSVNNAPRNTYPTCDDHWVAVSTSAQSIAERVLRLVGHPEVVAEPWFASARTRAQHADILDEYVGSWIAERTQEEVIRAFEDAEAAVAPIYDIAQVMSDPQYTALDSITTIDDPELGRLRMQNVMFRLSATPGKVRGAGRRLGEDNLEIYCGRLGLSEIELEGLRERGVV